MSNPVTIDIIGDERLGNRVAILRPDSVVEETDQNTRTLDGWLADAAMLERMRGDA